jgi:iron complex transport system substrate-binding protein
MPATSEHLQRPGVALRDFRRGPRPARERALFAWPVGAALRRLLVGGWIMVGVSAAAANPVVVRDDRGVEHRFDAPPQRVVTLLPSLTEAVCAIGACGRLVGTDRYSNWPTSVVALPKLGGLDDAVIERIVGLRPEVVLAASSTRALARLESLGLKVLRFDSDSHEQVRSTLERLGRLFGATPAAHAAWKSVEADMALAADQVPLALRGRKVYFEADATPYAAGEASFVGQTLQRLHLRNIAPAALGAFPHLSPEFVVQAQPQVILAARRNATQMKARPGWQQLPALQGGQVCALDEATYELLIRPGPRMGEAAKAMAACLAALPPAGPTPR